MSRVGPAENHLLSGGQMSTSIASSSDARHFDDSGRAKYKNQRLTNSADRTLLQAFNEIKQMGERLRLPKKITVIISSL